MERPTQPSATLVCPKCQGAMRSYERSGITIDQCTECRGVFLDRGELEKLLDAEAEAAVAREPDPAFGGRERPRIDADDRGYRDHDRDDHDRNDDRDRFEQDERSGRGLRDERRYGRRESRLGGLFDIFGGGD